VRKRDCDCQCVCVLHMAAAIGRSACEREPNGCSVSHSFFWRLHFLRYFLIPEFKQVVGCVENWSRVFRSLLFYAAPFPLFPLPALVAILNRLFDTLSPAFSNIFNSPRYSLFRRFPSATS